MWKNIVTTIVAMVVCFLVLEAVVRVSPETFGAQPGIDIVTDPDVGYRLKPGSAGAMVTWPCYRIAHLPTTAEGFRAVENVTGRGGGPTIGLLGDSFAECGQTEIRDSMASVMASTLGSTVYNGGVSSYQTVVESIYYRKFFRPLKPDVVVVALLLGNDFLDNVCPESERTGPPLYKPCGYLDGDGKLVINGKDIVYYKDGWLLNAIKEHCAVCRVVARQAKVFAGMWSKQGVRWLPYMAPSDDPKVVHAWGVLEQSLLRIKADVEADGGRVYLLPVISTFDFDVWRRQPEGTSMASLYPFQRLNQFSRDHGLGYIDLPEVFETYAGRHDLQAPHFFLRCDAHWSVIGQAVAGLAVAREVAADDAGTRAAIDALLAMPPKDFIGADAYKQIFQPEAVFTGATSISERLRAAFTPRSP